MYGKKKMMGGGKMPKPMMKKGGKMSALVIMAKPEKKAEAGAEMMGPKNPKKKNKKAIKVIKKAAMEGAMEAGQSFIQGKKGMKKGGYMEKGGKMVKSKAPKTFAPKSPKMMKGGKMKSC